MSDTETAPAAIKAELSLIERLPPGTIIKIFSKLPNLKSVLHLSLASRRLHTILTNNEGAISRAFAIELLNTGDPWVVMLAFTACESRMVDCESRRDVSDFIGKYLHREVWPLDMYRFQALQFMPEICMAVETFMDWMGKYGMLWPLKLESKVWTYTEAMRITRWVYALEIYVTLFEAFEEELSERKLQKLASKFWHNFSTQEVHALGYLLAIIGPYFAWARKFWSISNGYSLEKKLHCVWPWRLQNPLQDTLNFIRLARSNSAEWAACSRVHYAMRHSHPTDDGGPVHNRPPFALDSTWYNTTKERTMWMITRSDDCWRLREHYFDPRAYGYTLMHKWFFAMGDTDRCQSIRDHGDVWSWHGDPPEWSGHAWLATPIDNNLQAMMVWNEDPSPLGLEGSAGTVVDIRDLPIL